MKPDNATIALYKEHSGNNMASLLSNKKIRYDYEILEKLEAGLELLGTEVKALRAGRGTIAGAYIGSKSGGKKGEFYLMGADIPPYQPKNAPSDYNPTRDRKILLTQKEIEKLAGVEKRRGITIVPLSIYAKGHKLKAEIAVVKGKREHDKRQSIKKREADIHIERVMKGNR